MKIAEHRKNKLLKLIREEYGGVQTAFADAIGRQQDYVSRILSGKKGLGERLAREIEYIIGKPRGWLDADEDSAAPLPTSRPRPEWPFKTIARTRFNRLSDDEKLLVEGAALKVILEIEERRSAGEKSGTARSA